MPNQLVCRPEQDLPVAVLRVSGVLDRITATALHSAIRSCLAAQPDVLLVDVADLVIDESDGLDVLTDVVNRTAEWPAVPIVLCGAGPATTRRIAESGARGAVGVVDSCAHALAARATASPTRRLRIRLQPVPGACRQARQLVAQACTAWQLSGLVTTGALVASELVANVVRHARTGMEFTVGLREGRIVLAVRDWSSRMPRQAEPGPGDVGGRGLRLVRDLADSWGVLPVSGGKVVWTTLSAPASPGGP